MLRRIVILVAAVFLLATGVAWATPKDDWPKINGELWINSDDTDETHEGGPKNDELLGGHGDDVIFGERGADVIWGDYKPDGQPLDQHDSLNGGAGRDFIYASHGWNTIDAGPGPDFVKTHWGYGIVDCGPGRDTLWTARRNLRQKKYKIRNCERVRTGASRAMRIRMGLQKP